METSRPIPGQPGYFCDADGFVWSTKSGVAKKMHAFVRGRRGHLGVNLTQGGVYRLHSVHVLVALAWLGPRPTPQHIVMHADDNPANNSPVNLRWGLPIENSAQMVARGRQARGAKAARSKLTAADVAEIRTRIGRGDKQRDIAATFGISTSTITDIKQRKTWKAD